jgi:hypothetical protein
MFLGTSSLFDVDALSQGDLRAIAIGELIRRAKISAARQGLPHSDETRQKIGASVRRSWARRKANQADVQRLSGAS